MPCSLHYPFSRCTSESRSAAYHRRESKITLDSRIFSSLDNKNEDTRISWQARTIFVERYANGTTKRFILDSDSRLHTVLVEHTPTKNGSHDGMLDEQLAWLPNVLKNFILPAGFPGSVSEDYLDYMLLQFPTNVTAWLCHTLVTSSLLKAVGVGSFSGTTAAASAAAMRWVSKDGLGAIGRLFIGGRFGNLFDDDPKQWRMYADFIGSVGSIFELITPVYPAYFLPLASLGNLAKAVARGLKDPSFRVIQNHFATYGNLGEVAAKEEVWEVAAQLFGLAFGILVMINLKRARLLVRSHVLDSSVPGYVDCNKQENILSWEKFSKPRIVFGVAMEEMLGGNSSSCKVKLLLKLYAQEKYILVTTQPQPMGDLRFSVSFKVGATGRSVLRSLWQAYWLHEHWEGPDGDYVKLEESLLRLEQRFPDFLQSLEAGGWDIDQIKLKVPKELLVEEIAANEFG